MQKGLSIVCRLKLSLVRGAVIQSARLALHRSDDHHAMARPAQRWAIGSRPTITLQPLSRRFCAWRVPAAVAQDAMVLPFRARDWRRVRRRLWPLDAPYPKKPTGRSVLEMLPVPGISVKQNCLRNSPCNVFRIIGNLFRNCLPCDPMAARLWSIPAGNLRTPHACSNACYDATSMNDVPPRSS